MLYNCANPPTTPPGKLSGRRWKRRCSQPPERSGAVYAITGNLGKPPVKVTATPAPLFAAVSWVVPVVRELRELDYQWKRPYVLDESAAREHFGIEPTPWPEVCRRTAEV